MSKYFINYNTGAGNIEIDGSIEEAMKLAEEELGYTQQNVSIEQDGEQIAYLPWWGVIPEEDDFVTKQFGDYGFYGEWVLQEN